MGHSHILLHHCLFVRTIRTIVMDVSRYVVILYCHVMSTDLWWCWTPETLLLVLAVRTLNNVQMSEHIFFYLILH